MDCPLSSEIHEAGKHSHDDPGTNERRKIGSTPSSPILQNIIDEFSFGS
jgi:hypothetical protein